MVVAVHWTPAMVDDFISLLRQGEDLKACAAELSRRHGVGLSLDQVGRKLAKLRKGPRKAEVPAPNALRPGHWSPRANGELLHLVDDRGMDVAAAAAHVGQPEVQVARKLAQLRRGDGGQVEMPNPRRRMRHCLRCRHPFVSEGAHNRMCTPCRQAASEIDADCATVAVAGLML